MRYLPAVLIALLAFAPAAEAGSSKPTCSRSGSQTVASNSSARVYTVASRREFYGDILFGCYRRSGRHVRLAESYDDELYASSTFSKVRLNGNKVVWQSQATDVSCKDACPPGYEPTEWDVSVADVRTRRTRTYPGLAKDALFVTRGGTPAWLEDSPDGVQVRAGTQVIDFGQIDGLALRGRVLSWTNAGTPMSATLK